MFMLADVLQRFGEPAVPVLLPLAKKALDTDVRVAAISALASIGSLRAGPDLARLTVDKVADVRAQSIAALGKLGDRRATAVVSRGLRDKVAIVRLQAAQAAGLLQMENEMPVLAELLGDASWWVRYRAAEALIRLGSGGLSLLRVASGQKGLSGQIAGEVLAEMGAL